MPEVVIDVRWPGGREARCYSPSSVVEQFFVSGASYPVPEFVARARTAFHAASERVREKYGFTCSSALDQLATIEATAGDLPAAEAEEPVTILRVARARHASVAGREPAVRREHYPVVVIGGGQAGLSTSHGLVSRGISHVVLERHRVAHAWRDERWDTFCLVTPNWQCRLPGYDYENSYQGKNPEGFMKKDEIVHFLEGYAKSFPAPLREGVDVQGLARHEADAPRDGAPARFVVKTDGGEIATDHVVIATGGYHLPRIPAYAATLPSSIVQVHSSKYKNPEALPPGAVLVVGTGQSGCQIAEDLHLAGRKVHLAVGNAPRCARRYRGRDVVAWLEDMGHYEVPIEAQPNPDEVREKTNHYVTGRDGGHDLDLRQFALEGMELYGSLRGVEGGFMTFDPDLRDNLDAADAVYDRINRGIDAYIAQQAIAAPPGAEYVAPWAPEAMKTTLDATEEGITSIVWCIGFSADYAWIDLPVFDDKGRPSHRRGVSEEEGIYFLGLPWLHTWGSGRMSGVGTDSEYVVATIAGRLAEGAGEGPRASAAAGNDAMASAVP